MQTPCRKCEKRTVACHSSCEQYRAWQAKLELAKKERAKEIVSAATMMNRVRQCAIWKLKRGRRN